MNIKHVVVLFWLVIHTTNGAEKQATPHPPPPKKKWQTLHGDHPVVVANGGMSGIFPESSYVAYGASLPMSLPGSHMLCDLKLTKDNMGYCLSKMTLQNTTNVAEVLPDIEKTYDVNGKKVTGWFGIDVDYETIFKNITLIQSTFTRPSVFDNEYALTPPEVLHDEFQTNNIWINVEYDMFYKLHKLDVQGYIEEYLLQQVKMVPPYISSPEIGFLKSIGPRVRAIRTKIFLKFPSDVNEVEPSTKDKYVSLLKKLNTIRSFATGILVPKEYIWPVNEKSYLEAPTTLVTDAHKQGLEVFAYGFANDFYLPYNYSLDPANEYLQFIDNSHFSVDGVITDFSSTASTAIGCLAHNKNSSRVLKKLVISHNGASGDYPGATDLAYQKAVDDGADIIDCNVQLSKDGVAFCQDSADLKFTTTAGSEFMDSLESIKEVNAGEAGIFSFRFSWDQIKALKPRINSPYDAPLDRNPAYQFAGKFVTLKEFLEFAKAKPVKGIMIGIENAGYLATNGYDLIGIITSALTNASFYNNTKQKVIITSDETAVLSMLKNSTKFETVLEFRKDFSTVPANLPTEIHKYADAVSIRRNSLVLEYGDPFFMSKNFTNAVRAMKAANLTVYISNLKNEFQTFLFDYNSDPYQEIATLFDNAGVDGVITDFPATGVAFMRSPCNDHKANLSYVFSPITPGEMFDINVLPILNKNYDLSTLNTTGYPPLTAKDINTQPIPPVANVTSKGEGPNAPDTATSADTAPPPNQDSSAKTLAPITTLVALAGGMLATLSF